MKTSMRIAMLAAASLGACGGHAATRSATPETLQAIIAAAHGGDTITLAAGDYPAFRITGKTWDPPLTIDASAGRMEQVALNTVSGLVWHGGSFDGKDTLRTAWGAAKSDHVAVDGLTVRHYTRNGLAFDTVSDGKITNNLITDSGSDGIDIALSRRVLIDRNECRDTKPTEGAHPDCIQMWSRPTQPPVADITITNNKVTGDTQGFTGFNHIRDGVDDGGFDRIIIEHNSGAVTNWHGIAISPCRDCVVRYNHIDTIPNGRIKAWIKASGPNLVMCGNVATAWSKGEDAPCKK